MRMMLCALGALTLAAACGPAETDTNNPAIATDESTAERYAEAPAAGANSFTEAQARGRLAEQGYSDPIQLTQAADGTWRGQAMRDGQSVEVTVDYQGNVTTGAGMQAQTQTPGQ